MGSWIVETEILLYVRKLSMKRAWREMKYGRVLEADVSGTRLKWREWWLAHVWHPITCWIWIWPTIDTSSNKSYTAADKVLSVILRLVHPRNLSEKSCVAGRWWWGIEEGVVGCMSSCDVGCRMSMRFVFDLPYSYEKLKWKIQIWFWNLFN